MTYTIKLTEDEHAMVYNLLEEGFASFCRRHLFDDESEQDEYYEAMDKVRNATTSMEIITKQY